MFMILIDLQIRILKCKCSRNLYQSQCDSDIIGAKVFLGCKKIWAKYPPGRNFSQAETSVRAKCPHGEMSVRAIYPQGETTIRAKCPQGEMSARVKCPQGEMSPDQNVRQAEMSPGRNVHQGKMSPGRNVHQAKMSTSQNVRQGEMSRAKRPLPKSLRPKRDTALKTVYLKKSPLNR